MRYLRMENWIRNQDSFYVTKDDQKISFSDDFIKSEERTTGLGKGIYSTYKYFDTYKPLPSGYKFWRATGIAVSRRRPPPPSGKNGGPEARR